MYCSTLVKASLLGNASKCLINLGMKQICEHHKNLRNIQSKKVFKNLRRYFTTVDSISQDDSTKIEIHKMSFKDFDKECLKTIDIKIPTIPNLSKSFADFANFSESLQALIKMGVELYAIERTHPEALEFLATLDLKRDMKSKMEFLLDLGIQHSEISEVITKNPMILDPKIDIPVMKEVVDYLIDKKFTKDERLSLLVRCPAILTIPLLNLDSILGFFQKLETNTSERKIHFTNKELRIIIIRCPSLILSNLYEVYEQIRTLELSCDFTLSQIRKLILGFPHILTKSHKQLTLLYKFYIREMKYTNEELVDFPMAFGTRVLIVMERHYYLKHLKKAQYKRDKPGYISLDDVFRGTDETFCEKLGLGDVKTFRKFIKTL